MHMVLHIDGSRRVAPKGTFADKPRWMRLDGGLVALTNNHMVELSGAVPVPANASGMHEMLALVEAVRFIQAAKTRFEDVTIFTDDEVVAYAAQALHPDNFSQLAAERVRTSLALVCKLVGDTALEKAALTCLMTSRFVKLKAHRFLVYHNRADYLSSQASLGLIGKPVKLLAYDDWLAQGFLYHEAVTGPQALVSALLVQAVSVGSCCLISCPEPTGSGHFQFG